MDIQVLKTIQLAAKTAVAKTARLTVLASALIPEKTDQDRLNGEFLVYLATHNLKHDSSNIM